MIHHCFYWCECKLIKLYPCVNHAAFIQKAEEARWLKIIQHRGDKKDSVSKKNGKFGQSYSWCIINALMHERLETSKKIKGSDERIDSLFDQMHGLGTAFIGSFLAIPFSLFFYSYINDLCFSQLFEVLLFDSRMLRTLLIIAIPILIIHGIDYSKTAKHCEDIVEIVLLDVLQEEFYKKPILTPTEINIKIPSEL